MATSQSIVFIDMKSYVDTLRPKEGSDSFT